MVDTTNSGEMVPAVKSEKMQSEVGAAADANAPEVTSQSAEAVQDNEFLCPICMKIIKDAFLTSCGHSFFYMCILTHLKNKSDCSCCGHYLNFSPIFYSIRIGFPQLSISELWSTEVPRPSIAGIPGSEGIGDDACALAAAIEDTSINFGDIFKGPLPGKFLKLLGFLVLSRLGIYIPLGGVNREAFVGNLDQNSLMSTLDSFSGGGIGRLGICSLGIVPFINASIVFQLLTQLYPKLQELHRKEGEAGRKKILKYTHYASVGFAVV